jgi:hypothetical protein
MKRYLHVLEEARALEAQTNAFMHETRSYLDWMDINFAFESPGSDLSSYSALAESLELERKLLRRSIESTKEEFNREGTNR